MKKLDRSKPFNEVVGDDPDINYRYMQDGVKFDNQEREIVGKSSAKKDDGESAGGEGGGVIAEIQGGTPAAASKGKKKAGGK